MISIIIMGIKKRIPNTIDSIISNTLFSFFIVILLFCKHLYLLNFLLRFYHKINIFSSCLCGQKENSTYEKSSFLKCLIKIPIGNAVLPDLFLKKDLSLSVSRVLSCTAIYLGLPSPASSSDIHGGCRTDRPVWQTPNLAAGGVYMAYRVTAVSVSSYLAFPSLQSRNSAVYFCCTFLEVAFT